VTTDVAVVAAYQAIYWRLAVLAFVEDRPIAVCAALQGSDWLTVCLPRSGLSIGNPKPPTPDDVFRLKGFSPMLVRHDIGWGRADFFVKRKAEDQVGPEVQALNRAFRRSGDAGFPPEDSGAPLEERWHLINGIAAVWVQLAPDPEARTWMIDNGKYQDIEDLDAPRWESYPPEWQPLLDIPDEAAGVTALDRCIDELAASSTALKQRIAKMTEGRPAVLAEEAH
jgi:hypothetical protein